MSLLSCRARPRSDVAKCSSLPDLKAVLVCSCKTFCILAIVIDGHGSRRRLIVGALAVVATVALLAPIAHADQSTNATTALAVPSRISTADPLNGGFLLLNMYGMLFHPDTSDIAEDLSYARWLGGGIVRVFATDSNGGHEWDGTRVGTRLADIAPMLRANHIRLIVAFVNNHKAVPGEAPGSTGWMDNYMQLLLPFYTDTWRGAYLKFMRDLISTVEWYNAQDVIYAWELGNELHTPRQPDALIPFITQDVAEVRAIDPVTPILPGTMGANHVEPGNPNSSIARWLYCDAPVDAYTLHAYDWISRQRPGDMPIDWDLDNILPQPCPNGRTLPVIVEELGTSRVLPGVYTAGDEASRLQQEQHQIQFVRQFPQVIGWGVWNAESPRLVDKTFVDLRRGLTSYGGSGNGGGSCYDPAPDPTPGVRCQLEQVLRGVHFVRVANSSEWVPGPDADGPSALIGSVDPALSSDASNTLNLSGWVADPSANGSSGIQSIDVRLGSDPSFVLGTAQLGQTRSLDNPDWDSAGFSVSLPIQSLPVGVSSLTLAAHTLDHGTWLSIVGVVVPNLGPAPPLRVPIVPAAPAAAPSSVPLHAEIESPQPGDPVNRSLLVQVLAQGADRVDIFLEPDRDFGGRMVGSSTSAVTSTPSGALFRVPVSIPLDGHTLYVHVSSTATRQEQVLTLPIVVRS